MVSCLNASAPKCTPSHACTETAVVCAISIIRTAIDVSNLYGDVKYILVGTKRSLCLCL
jgi:hypothetical protein